MKRHLLSFVAVSALLVACDQTQTRQCGQHQCTAIERCDQGTLLCVQDEAPRVTVNPLGRLVTAPVLYVSGTASDDVAVAALEWSLDDGASWNAVALLDGQFTFEVNVGTLDAEGVKVSVRATDSLGQQTVATEATVVDDVAPAITLVSPTAPVAGTVANLVLAVEDGSGSVTSVSVEAGGIVLAATRGSGDTWLAPVAVPADVDLSGLAVTVQAKDLHDNLATASLTLPIDTRGPTGGFAAPVSGAVLIGHDVEVHVTGSDGSGVAAVHVAMEGEPGVAATLVSGQWVAQVALPMVDHQPRQLWATLTDGVGNQTTVSLDVVVDSVGPVVSLISPAADAVLGAATLDVSGTVGTDAVWVSVALGSRAAVPAQVSGSAFSAQLALPVEDFTSELVTVSAADAMGNVTTSSRWIFVDRVAPVLSAAGIAPNQVFGLADLPAGGAVAFSAVVVDGDPQAAGAWSLNGSTWTPGTSVSVATAATDNGVQYAVTLRAQDRAGNQSTLVQTFTVDRVPPVVSFTAPAAGSLTGSALVTASVSVNEPSHGLSFTLGGGAAVAASAGSLSANLPTPQVDYSAQVLTATVLDAANNVGTATRTITVDRQAPLLNVAAPTEGQKFGINDLAGTAVAFTTVANDADPQITVEYSLDGSTWLPIGVASVALATSPTDNPRSYSVQARSTDRAGNRSTMTRTYSVDRVAPTVVSLVPADGARNVDPVATVTFSEPVYGPTTSSDAFALSPQAPSPGAWDPAHKVFSAALNRSTVYQLSAAGLADPNGNAVVGTVSSHFRTAANAPASGSVIAPAVSRFWAVADGDGVPLVAYTTSSWDFVSAAWDQTSSQFQARVLTTDAGAAPGAEFRVALGASAVPQADLSAQSAYGTTFTRDGLSYTSAMHDASGWSTSSAALPVISPPLTTNGQDGTNPWGGIWASTYNRGTFNTPAPAAPQSMVATGATRWASVRMTGSTLSWDEFACPTTAVGGTVCSFTTSTSPGSVSTRTSQVSQAMSPDGSCLAIAYDGTAGRTLALQGPRVCGRGACSPGAVTTIAAPAGLQLAPTSTPGGGLLGAWVAPMGPGLGNTLHLGITSSCDGTFTELAVPPGLGIPSQFQPVQLGNKPGLLYIDANAFLKVYVP